MNTTQSAAPGKYLTFRMGREEYGVPILTVRELVGWMDITRVPGSKPFVRGIVNLRGRVIPIIDLRLKFDMTAAEQLAEAVIMVTQITSPTGDLTVGVIVDEVLEVLSFDASQLEPAPQTGAASGLEAEFLRGVGKVAGRVLFLLDLDKVLTAPERAQLGAAAAA